MGKVGEVLTLRIYVICVICAFLGISFWGIPFQAWGASGTAATASGLTDLNGNQVSFLPPSLESSNDLKAFSQFQMGTMLSSCGNTTAMMDNTVLSMIQQKTSGLSIQTMPPACMLSQQVGVGTPCVGSDQVPPGMMQPNCSTLNPAMITQMASIDASAACTAQCMMRKAQADQSELQCLTNEMNNIQQEMMQAQQQVQAGLQVAARNVMTYQNYIGYLTSVSQDAETKLNGDKQGNPGLVQVQQSMIQLTQQRPQQIQQVVQMNEAVQQMQQGLTSMINTENMQNIFQCVYSSVMPEYRITPNGPPTTFANKLENAAQLTAMTQAGGVLDESPVSQQEAGALVQEIDGALQRIGNLTPGSNGSANVIESPAEIMNVLGSQVASIPVGNSTVGELVMQQVQYCNGLSQQKIQNELSQSGFVPNAQGSNSTPPANNGSTSQLAQAQFNLQVSQQQAQQTATQYLNDINNDVTAAWRAMTGNSLPLNLNACQNTTLNQQIQCLQQASQYEIGLLNGTIPQAAAEITLNGNGTSPNPVITCSGVQGCMTALENTDRNSKHLVVQTQNQQQNYILQENQSVDTGLRQLGSTLSPASQAIQQQLAALNKDLASINASPINLPALQGKALSKDSNGLYQFPSQDGSGATSILQAAASYVQPPLPDTSQLASQTGGMSQAIQSANMNYAMAMQQLSQLQNLEETCQANMNEKALDAANSMAGQIANANCQYAWDDTGDKCQQNLATTMALIQQLQEGKLGVQPDQITSLNAGISSMCDPSDIVTPTGQAAASAKRGTCNQISTLNSKIQSVIRYQQGGGTAGSAL